MVERRVDCPSDEWGLGGSGLGEVGSPSLRRIRGGGEGRAPSTPPSSIEMPREPLGSLGGDIDPSRIVAVAKRVAATMVVYLARRKRGYP